MFVDLKDGEGIFVMYPVSDQWQGLNFIAAIAVEGE